jgi:3-dehydroquinate dehydratase I
METETKICMSIGKVPFDTIIALLGEAEMAEIRLDLALLSEDQVKAVFSAHDKLIATCREGGYTDVERARLLEIAVEYGAAWIDVEAGSRSAWKESMIKLAGSSGTGLILSHHYYTHTPGKEELTRAVDEMREDGADIVKIAALVNEPADAARLLGLYSMPGKIVSIGMGPLGVITRLAAPFLGAPFTFASTGDDHATAGGQIEYGEMAALIKKISSYG